MNVIKKSISLFILISLPTISIQASQESEKVGNATLSEYVTMYPHLDEGFNLARKYNNTIPSFYNFMDQKLAEVDDDTCDQFAGESNFAQAFANAIHQAENIIFDMTKRHFLQVLNIAIERKDEDFSKINDQIFQYVLKYSVGVVGTNGLKNNNQFMTPIVKQWINEKDLKGSTLLHHTASKNVFVIAQMLINADANPNNKDSYHRNPLYEATCSDATEVAQILIDAGADINIKGWNPLHVAATKNNTKLIQMLLAAGADINLKNCDFCNFTPLHCAAHWNAIDAVKILLNAGADSTAIDREGKTAREVARTPEIEAIFKTSFVNRLRSLILFQPKNK